MKKVFLIFSLINPFFGGLNAQNVVIEASKMNVLYIGVDNPIDIAMSNVASNKLKVSIDNEAILQKISAGHFNVRVMRPGQVTITVEANQNNNIKVFYTSLFNKKNLRSFQKL